MMAFLVGSAGARSRHDSPVQHGNEARMADVRRATHDAQLLQLQEGPPSAETGAQGIAERPRAAQQAQTPEAPALLDQRTHACTAQSAHDATIASPHKRVDGCSP